MPGIGVAIGPRGTVGIGSMRYVVITDAHTRVMLGHTPPHPVEIKYAKE